MKLSTAVLVALPTFALVNGQNFQDDMPMERQEWWGTLSLSQKTKLTSLFDSDWFEQDIDDKTQIAYAHAAQEIFDFLESGQDSHPDDFYTGFAPLLLRASFHGAGSYTHATGVGGSNGGTIFNHAELSDGQNGCIAPASSELFDLFHGSNSMVPLADTMVIAGVVALDVMEFPRMDLLSITGGRDTIDNVAHRDRLPSADDDPMDRFTQQYDLTLSQAVALVGGAHNFGAAHGKCTGYQGQWTASPLSWFGPNATDPTFFPDLLLEDWRWYEVCTYDNNTVHYVSMEDPFADGAQDEEEEQAEEVGACLLSMNLEPVICEEQAMRGYSFEDGNYQTNESPCDVDLLQIRLKSDFFLKANDQMLPFAQAFAVDPALLAQEFGTAYHKITRNGLERCGLSGHGCPDDYACQQVGDDPMAVACIINEDVFLSASALNDADNEDNFSQDNAFIGLLSMMFFFGTMTVVLLGVVLFRINALAQKAAKDNTHCDNASNTTDESQSRSKKTQKASP